MGVPFDDAYAAVRSGISSTKFSDDKDWQSSLKRARKLVAADGFDDGESDFGNRFRRELNKAATKGTDEATTILTHAGAKGNGQIDKELAERLGALKTIRHRRY